MMNQTFVTAIAVAVVALAAQGTALAPSRAEEAARPGSSLSELIGQCRQEAVRGHLRELHARHIKRHRAHMSDICVAWISTESEGDRLHLLSRCKREAMVAAGLRGRSIGSRSHGLKLASICEQLHAASGT